MSKWCDCDCCIFFSSCDWPEKIYDDGYGNTIEFSDVPKQSYPNNPMYCVGCGARVEGD